MDASKMKKLKMHLTEALACLDDYESDESAAPEPSSDDGDDDVAMSSLKMKMSKYK